MVESANLPRSEISPLPTHVAIIMDGNGRWAKRRGLTRLEGHRAGTRNIHRVVKSFADYQIKYLTLYAFSTENWGRPKKEIRGLFQILAKAIDREVENLHKEGIRILHLGELDGLSPQLQAKVREAINLTRENSRMTLSLAFNYGGRAEILRAVRQIIQAGIPPEEINEATFARFLYTAELPEPDLIIRTAGELRLSNFLIWQAAYSEYYTTPTLWPDFDEEEVKKALVAYSRRERRFGKIGLG